MQVDCRGLALTTSSEGAAKQIDQAVTDYLDYRTTASGHVKAALEQDPAFVLALCFRGYFLLMLENKAILPKVKQTLDEIRPNLDAATRRERLHVKALEAWAAGDIMKACFHWEEILTDCPLDLLALKLHHTMTFYTGRSQVMRSVVASVLGEWGDEVPGYGCVQGMYAYALEECGAYDEAERWGRQAVERNPGDLWAIHSVAHVLEMQGRSAEGVKWLNYTPEQWAQKNPFKAHVWWHAALFFLAQGEYDRALEPLRSRALLGEFRDLRRRVQPGRAAQAPRDERRGRGRSLEGAGRAFGKAHPRPHAAVPGRALLSRARRERELRRGAASHRIDGRIFRRRAKGGGPKPRGTFLFRCAKA